MKSTVTMNKQVRAKAPGSKAGKCGVCQKGEGRKGGLVAKRGMRPQKPAAGGVGLAAPGAEPEAAPTLPGAVEVIYSTGVVKLDVSRMSPPEHLNLLTRVGTGMAAVPAYASLPVLTDVNGVRTSLSTQLLAIADMETALKAARDRLMDWVKTSGVVLNRAAVACENEENDANTLITAGWTLRSGRSPSQVLPAPSGLKLRQSPFAGQGTARWKSVPNARYYEVQVDPVPGAALTIAAPVLLNSTRVEVALPELPPGSLVQLCVRAVGAKGPGPFCDALTSRVN